MLENPPSSDQTCPVTSFDINRYLGQWYEIARLDHSFERGMSDVNATYQLQDDGSVKVITGATTRSARRGRRPSAVRCSSAIPERLR